MGSTYTNDAPTEITCVNGHTHIIYGAIVGEWYQCPTTDCNEFVKARP